MGNNVAVVTMVRDDLFFLRAWLAHYGGQFGRENLYIVNHGRGTAVAELAEGCNIIGIPGDAHKNFDMKRWRLLNGLLTGLRPYYDHVIVGDVDELVVVDPAEGVGLAEFMRAQPTKQVLNPLGLEVIHRIDLEDEVIGDKILGPRRHVRVAHHYSKPCIVSAPSKLSRGGHYSEYDKMNTPDCLYLMHLKFCDFANFTGVMDRRNEVTAEIGEIKGKAAIGTHWFAEARGEDRAVFEAFADLKMMPGFDMTPYRDDMRDRFRKRGDDGLYHFDRQDYGLQFELPERFNGLI